MQYNHRCRLDPSEAITETLLHHVDTCRQLYSHALYLLNDADDIPARYEVQGQLLDRRCLSLHPPSVDITLSGANEDIDERTVIQDRNGDEIAVTGDEVEAGP